MVERDKPVTDTPAFDLNVHMFRLLQAEPFFAALSRRVDKVPSTSIPTAGVRVNPTTGYFELMYNPVFMASLSDAHRLGVLKHEFYHLVFGHVTDRLPSSGMTQKWNIATDAAINSLIPGELPDWCVMPGCEIKPEAPLTAILHDLPLGKSAEWYMAHLPDPPKSPNGAGSGEGSGDPSDGAGSGPGSGRIDDHGSWSNGSGVADDIARERAKEILRGAAREANSAGSWGTVSADCRKEIMRKLDTFVDWRKVLRWFIGATQRAAKTKTIKKLNKRFPYIIAGSRVNRFANIAICEDQSGSVSDEMLAEFHAELDKLSSIATFTFVPFDTVVDTANVFVWKKGSRKNPPRTACGGTDFNAPTDYVNEHGFDGMIVLTDLCAPKPRNARCRRLWMTDRANASHPYFQTPERVIIVEKAPK